MINNTIAEKFNQRGWLAIHELQSEEGPQEVLVARRNGVKERDSRLPTSSQKQTLPCLAEVKSVRCLNSKAWVWLYLGGKWEFFQIIRRPSRIDLFETPDSCGHRK